MYGAGSSGLLVQQGCGAACVVIGWGCLRVLLVRGQREPLLQVGTLQQQRSMPLLYKAITAATCFSGCFMSSCKPLQTRPPLSAGRVLVMLAAAVAAAGPVSLQNKLSRAGCTEAL